MARTDLGALTRALASGNIRKIHEVLTHPVPDTAPGSTVETAYSSRLLAAHFLRRMAEAVERGWRIDPDEMPVLLEFLYDYQADLKPPDAQKD